MGMAQWQDRLRQKLGKDMKAASRKAGLGATAVRDVLERRPDPKLSTIEALARAHEFSIDELLDLPRRYCVADAEAFIPIRGHVAAGVWLEVDAARPWEETLGQIPVLQDRRYPPDSIYGLIVRGNSINKTARDGEVLVCLDVGVGIEIVDGDLAIIERFRAQEGLREVTAKRFRRRASGMVELWPESDDPQWKDPIILDNRTTAEEVRAIARVEWIWKPATSLRGPGMMM